MGETHSGLQGLVERLGGHVAERIGIDLDRPGDRARWLGAARMASERDPEERWTEAFRRLDAAIGTAPGALAAADDIAVAALLERAGMRRPETLAAGLRRAATALEAQGGELEELASGCLDLEELGGRIAALAPGLGRATVLRFLRPLRATWSAARETPLAESARAAARHLALIAGGEDRDGEPGALLAACARLAPELPARDVEAALERLGARSCHAERPERCPLGEHCPARRGAAG